MRDRSVLRSLLFMSTAAGALLLAAPGSSEAQIERDEAQPAGGEEPAAGEAQPGVAEGEPARAGESPWAVPPEGSCAPAGGLRGWPPGEDAPPVRFEPGDVVGVDKASLLEDYLPPEIWAQREKLFYEGMRLEIGPCFRDYSPPEFFQEATERFRGEARLTENGGLEGYTAGLPFAPGAIDADDPDGGQKWAWNAAYRYAGAGFRGDFRVVDIAGPDEEAEGYEGEIFKMQLAHRADRPGEGYRVLGPGDRVWAAGGELTLPFDAREYAWRQYRYAKHQVDADFTDEIQVYIPERRRVRRASAANVEGLYMPTFAFGSPASGGVLPFAGGSGGGGAPIPGGSGTLMERRSGFEGLELRPLLYRFRVLGLQDVLAPINAANPAYPEDEDRDFGPWGLSFASDRWELRRALVLAGRVQLSRGPEDEIERLVQYVDVQTLQPLYSVAYGGDGGVVDVGHFVGRWSGDRPDYPQWPDDPERPVRVIDPAGATFVSVNELGGWRRESWNVVSVPPEDRRVKEMISIQNLTQQR